MKGKFLWILGTIEAIFGFALFLTAQIEIWSNSWYSWRRPYTTYEAQVILMKWIGIILLISGLFWIFLKMYQLRYTRTHTQEITPIVKRGGSIQCPNCSLTLSADVKTCPRCGKAINADKADNSELNKEQNGIPGFCSNCGNKIKANEMFCSKCGQKITK